MAAPKKESPAEMRKRIRAMRGKYKHLPLMETLKEMKREERAR